MGIFLAGGSGVAVATVCVPVGAALCFGRLAMTFVFILSWIVGNNGIADGRRGCAYGLLGRFLGAQRPGLLFCHVGGAQGRGHCGRRASCAYARHLIYEFFPALWAALDLGPIDSTSRGGMLTVLNHLEETPH